MPQQEPAKQQLAKSANTQRLDPYALPLESHRPAPTVAPTPPPSLSHATVQRALANPRALSPNDILHLQRTVGNQAVQRLLNPVQSPVQRVVAVLTASHSSSANGGKKQGSSIEQSKPNKDHQDGGQSSRYLEDGGTSRWRKDTGLGTSGYISEVDQDLKLYRKYKSKNLGTAEEQAELLLRLQKSIAISKYQKGFTKHTSTFRKRQSAIANLKAEVDRKLLAKAEGERKNLIEVKRLIKETNKAGKVEELTGVGFTKEFLYDLKKNDLDLLYEAHVYLGHKQMGPAQAAFDRLNPVQRDQGRLKYNDKNYIERTRNDLFVAQQMVISHHHTTIGGAYARAFKHEPMGKQELKKVKKDYLRNKDFLGGQSYIDLVKNGLDTSTLKQVVKDHRKLSKAELEALRIYTSAKYKDLNATMHDYRVDNPQEQKGFEGFSSINQLLMSALSKLPPYTGKPVMRGDFDFSGMTNTLRPGTIYQTPSVLSTTKKKEKPSWGNVWWRIDVGPNSRGRDVEKISVARGEGEVLFPPGTKFKIIDILRRQTNDPFALGPNPDPNGERRDGETMEDWVRRIYKSEGKQEISDSTMAYLITCINSCSNLIVVQEL